jgi:hypothetical protein
MPWDPLHHIRSTVVNVVLGLKDTLSSAVDNLDDSPVVTVVDVRVVDIDVARPVNVPSIRVGRFGRFVGRQRPNLDIGVFDVGGAIHEAITY